jgi:3-oxoacyl-[acyl-carrier-protein] synthase II
MTKKRIVVTGFGAITPIGIGNDEYCTNLFSGKSGAAGITLFNPEPFITKFGCEVKNFQPSQFIDAKSAGRMDRFCQFGVASAEMALKVANVSAETCDLTRVGVVFGSGIGGMITYDQQFRAYLEKGPDRVSPFFIPMLIGDIASGHISIRNKLQGPNYATTSACATSLNAIIDAYMILQMGYADIMVCGGSEASITPMSIAGFNSCRALSTRNDAPETASRPYDKDRDGFVIGEGAGALIIETLESAQRRGAKIRGEIVGVGMSGDAHHLTAPHPEGAGATLSMSAAIKDAGISPEQIDYVNTHGTSTPLGDVGELNAVKKVLGSGAKNVNISATKSMTGHLLGAAGAIETIACLFALEHQTVPPTINIQHLDPAVDVNVTPNHAQKRSIEYVLNNGFGFGGHNATLILKKVS